MVMLLQTLFGKLAIPRLQMNYTLKRTMLWQLHLVEAQSDQCLHCLDKESFSYPVNAEQRLIRLGR